MGRRYVEARHEVTLAQRVVDVRPATTKYAEWLSVRTNLALVVLPQIIIAFILPMLAPFFLFSAVIHLVAHRVTKPLLPFRYPACNVEPDPEGKKGNGILLLGAIDSDSEYERFKEVWLSDDDLRKHMLIIGSTGAGKSETLKGIFFNALCWSSGYFVADGKADNKLPTDAHIAARSFGREQDLLFLNFLLGGKTPEQVRRSRRRRTNKLNPVSAADADTIIQMGANLLPKVEGDGKSWQEKALNLWRAVIAALCYMRDTEGVDLSVATIIDHMALPMIEELYIRGYRESLQRGEWSYGYAGIKSYLDSGCPAYKVDKLLAKHGFIDAPTAAPGGRPQAPGKALEQESMAYEQHAYRTSQLMPVLNLLDKTYGFIFRDKYPEIDMIDVALNNRILVMMIPSLEKSSQEAENLGKLAIACLRVMMGKNLGADIEGNYRELLGSKATNAPYPFMVALDELAYYFSDGIAVMFAQARSLGMCMIAACQDLEKLTEGNRAAEAGAMLANQVAKLFGRIDDANKTYEFMKKILGVIWVPVRRSYEIGTGAYKRTKEVEVTQVDRIPLQELQEKKAGEGVFNAAGKTVRLKSFYMAHDLKEHQNDQFWVMRFLQVEPPSEDDLLAFSTPIDAADDKVERGARLIELLTHQRSLTGDMPLLDPIISAVSLTAKTLGEYVRAPERGIALYMAARQALLGSEPATAGSGGDLPQPMESGQVPPGREGVRSESRDVVNAGLATAQVPAAADVDGEADVFAFLGLDRTFERKPADLLLGRHAPAEAANRASAPVAAQAEVPDAVDRFVAAGKSIKIVRLAGDAGETMPASTAAVLQAVELAARGAEPHSLHGSVSTSSGSSMPGFDLEADDGASWVANAYSAAGASVAAMVSEGQSVVGFTGATLEGVSRIEAALGSPAPLQAARRLEVIVSAQVTPTPERARNAASTDDIDDWFEKELST